MKNRIRIVECPRDAIQGLKHFIPTKAKAKYLNELLKAGFDIIDFGSFVSPVAIPQLSDTNEVIKLLDLSNTQTQLLSIVGNVQGAKQACLYPEISFLGFPFSVSETFQIRNIGASIIETLERVQHIQDLCIKNNKELVIYLSMAFGNPYQEEWSPKCVREWVSKLFDIGIRNFSLADTTGLSKKETIRDLFDELVPAFPELDFGVHFHTAADSWREKVETAFEAGCRQFDTAILGYGGCPMSGNELIGNMPTDKLLSFIKEKGLICKIQENKVNHLEQAFQTLLIS